MAGPAGGGGYTGTTAVAKTIAPEGFTTTGPATVVPEHKPVLIAAGALHGGGGGRRPVEWTSALVTTITVDPWLVKRVEELQQHVARLDNEIQALHTAAAKQEIYQLNGYFIAVRPGTAKAVVARCPTLRAVAQGDSLDEAIADLSEAMRVAIEGRQAAGRPVPLPDVQAKCLE